MPHALPGDSVPHVAQEDRSRSGAGEPIPCHERKWKKRPARLHCRYMYVRVGAGAGRDAGQLLRASDARLKSVVHTVSILRALALRYAR